MLLALGILVLLATSQLAVGMVNWLATLLVTPRPLPRMDFSRGLPAQSRTLVAVPLKEIADWMEPFRQFWEEKFAGLDGYLKQMQKEHPKKKRQRGRAKR